MYVLVNVWVSDSNRPGFPVSGIPLPGLAILSYPGPGPGPGQMLIYDPGPGPG